MRDASGKQLPRRRGVRLSLEKGDTAAITRALVLRETEALRQSLGDLQQAPLGRPRVLRLIETAVAHQFGRSRLSRLLEVEEERLALGESLVEQRESMTALIRDALSGLAQDAATTEVTAQDVVAIIKGIIDSAGARHQNAPDLVDRVTHAVLGYLQSAA